MRRREVELTSMILLSRREFSLVNAVATISEFEDLKMFLVLPKIHGTLNCTLRCSFSWAGLK
jgi:hypothetical protein